MICKICGKNLPETEFYVHHRKPDGTVQEYTGAQYGKDFKVDNILATSYPMFKHVLEVTEDRHET